MAWIAWLACVLILWLPGGSGAETSAEEPVVEVRPAWNGVARSGRWTELGVHVVAVAGGEVEVEASSGLTKVVITGRVEAGVPRLLPVPVRVSSSGSVRVTVRAPRAAEREVEVPLRLLAPGRRAVGRLATPREDATPDGLDAITIELDALAFPRSAQAFRVLDALVVDAELLPQLDAGALRGLQGHVQSCGRVLAVGFSEAALSRWRARAGCDGALLRALEPGVSVAEGLRALLEQRPPALPGAVELAESLPKVRAAQTPLGAFLAGYVVVLLLGTAALRRFWQLALVPVAAAALLVAAFWASRPALLLTSWTEATSGSDTARIVALLRVDGLGRERLRIELPGFLGAPDPVLPNAKLHLRLRAGSTPASIAQVETALLSEHLLYLRGTVAWTSQVAVFLDGGAPRIVNRGATRSEPAFLLWQGEAFAVPPLEGGSTWAPTSTEPLPRAQLPSVIARRRRLEEGPVLAIRGAPEPLSRLAGAELVGWVLIRARGST